MKSQNYVGICLGGDTATVVCLDSQGRDRKILDCFSVSTAEQENPGLQTLVSLITQRFGEKEQFYRDAEIRVALNCSMYMQHKVHSEFTDLKQIAATIRFDTEEALATDISDVAIAFEVISSDQTGSQLAVFTAERKILSDILLALQSNNIDPVTMEPDVNCLAMVISQFQPSQEGILFGMFSGHSGYFISFSEQQKPVVMRTFLLSPTQDRNELLAREIPVTTVLTEQTKPIRQLRIFDSTGSVDYQRLSERIGTEINAVDLAETTGAEPQVLRDCSDMVDFAIAYGAALTHPEKTQTINFRNDFSPYQGKKVRLQKALKLLSISVVVLLLALGVYFQMLLLKTNKYRGELRKKLEKDYLPVMLDKKKLPSDFGDVVKDLNKLKRRIENVKQGLLSAAGEESLATKLTLLLKAFNECANKTDLSIDKIYISDRNISVRGETSSRKNTLKLFEVIEKGRLDISQRRFSSERGRNKFSITVVSPR